MRKARVRSGSKAQTEVVRILICLMAAALPGCNCGQKIAPTESFDYAGLARRFALYVPAGYNPATSTPVLVVLHGIDQTSEDIQYVTGFNELSEDYGFLAVYPESYENNWNDGRAVPGIPAYDRNVDDVGFIRAVLEHIAANYNVDVKRLYVCGFSNGAMMAQRLAFEESELYAAVATVAGTIPQNVANGTAPAAPIAVCMVHGKDDGLVPWEGGVLYPSDPQGVVLSVSDSIAYWVAHNACPEPPSAEQLPNRETLNRTAVIKYTYAPGAAGMSVVLYQVEGGGHAWPGSSQLQALFVQGNISKDLNASEAIWAFCAQHSR